MKFDDTEDIIEKTAKTAGVKPHYTGHRKRLRERFLASDPTSFADYELLELILFPAKPMGDVKPIAKSLISFFGSFGKVLHASPEELRKVDGVNEAAIVAIKVTRHAAERLLREEIKKKEVIKSWTQLLDYLKLNIGHNKNEVFHILFLNHKLELIADEKQQEGTIDHTSIYTREVVKRALELGASSIILAHNHPSGDVNPSKNDVEVTKLIINAAKPLGIAIHDHVIIGGNKYFSFKSKGII
ncbi:MAG: DNA repair protein RadC [Rickettsiales bacterium]